MAEIVSAIAEPEPAAPPLTPDWTTVHPKVAPATLLPSAMFVVPEPQNVSVEGVIVTPGRGLTVTVTVKVFPAQLLAVGVTV